MYYKITFFRIETGFCYRAGMHRHDGFADLAGNGKVGAELIGVDAGYLISVVDKQQHVC